MPPATSSQPNASSTSSQNGPIQSREAIQSVSATDHASPTGTIQLYYGASSNFSFLQHIYRSLVCGSSQKNGTTQNEVQEVGPGLDFFQQRRSYFALAPEYAPHDMSLDFLTLDCAKMLVHSYSATLGHMVPIWTEEDLLYRLTALHCFLQRNDGSFSPDKTMLLCILAIGAAADEMLDWAETLYIRAKSESIMLDDVVNLQAVQIPLLMVCPSGSIVMVSRELTFPGSISNKHGPCKLILYLSWNSYSESLCNWSSHRCQNT